MNAELTLAGLAAGCRAEGRVPLAYAVAGDAWLACAWATARDPVAMWKLTILAGLPNVNLYDQPVLVETTRTAAQVNHVFRVDPAVCDLIRTTAGAAPTIAQLNASAGASMTFGVTVNGRTLTVTELP